MSTDDTAPDNPFIKVISQFQRSVETRRFDDADAAALDLLAVAEDWSGENASPDFNLTTAACEFEDSGEWTAAESVYHQILCLSDLQPATEYLAHSRLTNLLCLLGRHSYALAHARCATAAARRADLSILLAMALKGESQCLIRFGEIAEADKLIAEAISALERDTRCDHLRAILLTLRAECAVHGSEIANAKSSLEEAFCLLEPMAEMHIAAGIHSGIQHWWSVTASLRARQDDHDGTISALQNALASAKHVASLSHTDNVYAQAAVASILSRLAEALLVCGRSDDAAAVIEEHNAVICSAGLTNTEAGQPGRWDTEPGKTAG